MNKKNAKFQDAVEIVKLYTEIDALQEDKYHLLNSYLRKYIIMYQFIFSNLFPKYYGKFNNRGVKNNIEFNSIYENYVKEATGMNWQKNEFLETLPVPLYEEESDNEIHIEEKKTKKKTEEEKKQKRIKRKLEMQKQKEFLEEKLKENTEKLYKIKKM